MRIKANLIKVNKKEVQDIKMTKEIFTGYQVIRRLRKDQLLCNNQYKQKLFQKIISFNQNQQSKY